MIECIETMTAEVSQSSVCGEQNDLMRIAMITTSLKYKVDNLCGPGQSEIRVHFTKIHELKYSNV